MQTDRTVLHYAAELGFCDVAKVLLEKQADVNAIDKVVHSLQCTALMAQWQQFICMNGHSYSSKPSSVVKTNKPYNQSCTM